MKEFVLTVPENIKNEVEYLLLVGFQYVDTIKDVENWSREEREAYELVDNFIDKIAA